MPLITIFLFFENKIFTAELISGPILSAAFKIESASFLRTFRAISVSDDIFATQDKNLQ